MLYLELILLASSYASVLALSVPYYEIENATQYFEYFIKEYDIQYADEQEKEARFQILYILHIQIVYKENLIDVNRLNAESSTRRSGEASAVFGITKFLDLTAEEYKSMYTGFQEFSPLQSSCYSASDSDIPRVNAPDSFEWRSRRVVTRVKNQFGCGCCYSFGATGHLESQYAIKYGRLIELSEQQIVDCDSRSNGCNGGNSFLSFMSIIDQGGIMSENDYPYLARKGQCRFNPRNVVLKVNSCTTYNLRSQEKLKQLLYTYGPIGVALRASNFQKYHGGVFNDRDCSEGDINHDVLLVGYGTDPKYGPYWLIKNSHGTNFGETGYIRVQRGEHAQSCGLMNIYMTTAKIQ